MVSSKPVCSSAPAQVNPRKWTTSRTCAHYGRAACRAGADHLRERFGLGYLGDHRSWPPFAGYFSKDAIIEAPRLGRRGGVPRLTLLGGGLPCWAAGITAFPNMNAGHADDVSSVKKRWGRQTRNPHEGALPGG